jgi:uncharacterized membrane protein YbhN (UPF0104 family)
MTVIRPAAANRRRARLRPAPTGRPGTVPARHTFAGAPGRSRKVRIARIAAALGAVAAVAGAGVAERSVAAASFARLGHVRWLWIPAALMLESASMAAFAIMQRRLLAAGGASVGIRPMLATTYAANAVSVSVPLAGPELATAYAFRRFIRQGADAPLAGWSLLAGGMVASFWLVTGAEWLVLLWLRRQPRARRGRVGTPNVPPAAHAADPAPL